MPDEPVGEDIVVVGARIQQGNQLSFTGGGGNSYVSFSNSYGTGRSVFGDVFSEQYVVSQDVPAPTNEDGDIVVEATPEQVAAAQAAFAKAGFNLQVSQVVLVVAATLVNKYLGAGVAAGEKIMDFTFDELQASLADFYYYQDGLDGSYDGIASPASIFGGFTRPPNLPGPKEPVMPDGEEPPRAIMVGYDDSDLATAEVFAAEMSSSGSTPVVQQAIFIESSQTDVDQMVLAQSRFVDENLGASSVVIA